MRLNFKAIQTQILNRFLQEIVFIELKENQSIKLAEASLPTKIQLPVVIEDLAETIRQNAYDQIPPLAILKGLVVDVVADAGSVRGVVVRAEDVDRKSVV